MSEYTAYDFEESLTAVGINKDAIEAVLFAWGESPEGYGSWQGGFILRMADGRYAKIEGWCDTSGWGCQDGADVEYSDTAVVPPDSADYYPIDLNLSLDKPDRFGPKV